jgi:hypothetical protein
MSTLKSTIEGLASQFAVSIVAALRSASIQEVMEIAGHKGAAAPAAAPAAAAAAPAKRGPGRPKKAAAVAAPAPAAVEAPKATGKKRGRPAGSTNKAPKAAPKAKKSASGRLGRRSVADIGALLDNIVSLLQQNPDGLRAEQIRSALGIEAKELPRPLADGVANGSLTKTGQKRATTYFAAGGKGKKRK